MKQEKRDHHALDGVRHSLAHLLAAAAKDLWPGTHNAIGPAIADGFYQDFDFGDRVISEKDFPLIEKRMRELLKKWGPFVERSVPAEEARKLFAANPYKLELLEEFAREGKNITVNDPGNFLDLCKGGHADNPQQSLSHFKLLSIAGAYWRGDEKKKMLTRIYGTAFATEKELKDFLTMREEAKKRDHKKLGVELDLFCFSDLVGPGLPMLLPKGTVVRTQLEQFVRSEKEKRGYSFVSIPHIARAALYKKSGHLGKYDAMMPIMRDEQGDEYVVKPMNCPHHFEIYNARPHSYKELPLRLAETTTVYRNEKSGELSGLVRVKSLTQDDTHHFVREDQIASEIDMILGLMDRVYSTLKFSDYTVQISIRDPQDPKKYFGGDALWKKSEQILLDAVKAWGRPYVIEEGEAAFYGPKIDIMVKDSIGRPWQLTTLQLDFNQPENFHLRYVGEDGKEHAPAVLHVAILGSIERFLGILIEHYAGAFPVWLAPVQVAIIPVSDRHVAACRKLAKPFQDAGVRVHLADSSDTVGYKIRRAEKEKIPYMIVFGDKEKKAKKLPVRVRGSAKLRSLSADTLRELIVRQTARRT